MMTRTPGLHGRTHARWFLFNCILAPGLALLAAGCGSTSLPGETGGGFGTGGSTAGSGGSGIGGSTAGSGGSGTGGSTAGSGGSGAGGSIGGSGGTSTTDGGASCTVGGSVYADGASGIKAPDGCNTCSCQGGQLSCTLIGCPKPTVCGGLQGLACGKGLYCHFATSAQCGAADQTGECLTRPQVCPEIYAPVCGCDDKTYSSACVAAGAGVSVAKQGACTPDKGSCTVNGVTYPDGAGGIPAADGCNVCSCVGGALACTRRACPAPKACGARAGNTCTANEYCAYTEGGYCGAADAQSFCNTRPQACDLIYAPVCGCDGKTYGNSCAAAMAGSGVLHAGPCSGSGRSCVVGGVTYADGTGAIPAADGCNTCTCTDGNLACTRIACASKTCGGIAGFVCSADEYCPWTEGQSCGAADATSTCVKRPEGCTTQFDPVCGCDGKTYSNACEAGRAGIGVQQKGACPS